MKTVLSRTLAAVCIAGLPWSGSADARGARPRAGKHARGGLDRERERVLRRPRRSPALKQDEAQAGVQMAKAMLSMPGINADGSAAIAITSLEGMNEKALEPPMVVLMPVSDYAALVGNFGGTGEGLEMLNIEGNEVFIQNVGGGYAMVGPSRTCSRASTPPRATRLSTRRWGDVMSDENTVLVIANMDHLREPMMQGWQETSQNMRNDGHGRQDPEQAEATIDMVDGLMEAFSRDAARADGHVGR